MICTNCQENNQADGYTICSFCDENICEYCMANCIIPYGSYACENCQDDNDEFVKALIKKHNEKEVNNEYTQTN